MFQPVYEKIANSDHILVWKSEALSDESIKPPAASSDSLAPVLNHCSCKFQVTFDGCCSKQRKSIKKW